jgi:putative peptidoglycan lipid II flippase
VIFSIGFSKLFGQIGWMPHGGLALANSLATALEATALFVVMRKRLNGIEGGFLAKGLGASALAASVMGLGVLVWLQFTGNWGIILTALGGVTVGGSLYMVSIWALHVPELSAIVNKLESEVSRLRKADHRSRRTP